MTLTRRVTFSSGHRYWFDDLSPEENQALFGEWASPYNHGHNYVLEAGVSGKIDPATGMVVNIKEIDEVLRRNIVSKYDQKSLNDEVSDFIGKPTSCESIAMVIWSKLVAELPPSVRLTHLRLYENPLLFIDMDEHNQMLLTRVYEFSASHRLDVPALSQEENVELFGKCNNPSGHGHDYILEVTVSGIPDDRTGMITDIGTIDSIVEAEVVNRYDHKHLNLDVPEFAGQNPTTEIVTRMIWNRLKDKLPANLHKVLVRETARNIFEYHGEDE